MPNEAPDVVVGSKDAEPAISDALTSAVPKTAATLTIRVIKSFEYRTQKSLVLHKLNLEDVTVGALKELVVDAMRTQPGWKAYRTVQLGTSHYP